MTINLSGELIPDDWAELYRAYGYEAGYYSPADVRRAIGELPEGEELVVEVNSVGGWVDGGSEIYSLLQGCKNPTRAVVQSMAASAASYMIMGCDAIDICLPAQIMIHNARGGCGGTKYDHQRDSAMLEAADESILGCYAARCGDKCDREQLRKLMDAETFLTAPQAVALGLADLVIGCAEAGGQMVAAEACQNIVRAMRVLPDIGQLKALREQEQEARDRLDLEAEISRYWGKA